jgi:uncharacterized protein YjbI with pentapeptide repeats
MNKITGLLWLLLGTLCLSTPGAARPVTTVTTVERPWLAEEEFLDDEDLHATAGQTMVLDLEGAASGQGAIRSNTVRLLVEEAREYSFCIPRDEANIQRVKVKRSGGPTVVNGAHGAACRPVLLEPGQYEVEIYHDTRGLIAGGRKAFVYRRSQSALGGSLTGPNLPQFDFMAIISFGKFVSSAARSLSVPVMQMAAVSDDVGPGEVWRVTPVTDSKFALTSGTGAGVQICSDENFELLTAGADEYCGYPYTSPDYVLRATFRREFVSGFSFGLQLAVAQNGSFVNLPVFVNLSDGNYLSAGGSILSSFTSAYSGYDCATTCTDATLPLSPGTIALYSQCNYQGKAIVFQANTPDLAIFNAAGAAGLGVGSDQARSVRVAPGTVAVLYPDAQYGGTALTAGANISCLEDTALGNDELSSFRIIDQSPINYILSSNGCRDCILTGIDFAGEDFDGFDFTGTSFAGANLISTSFQHATLSGTDFSGSATQLAATDFTGALLACASFWNANVTSTIFDNIVLTSSTSCRLDMEAATIDFTTFPPLNWRNTNLTASNMSNLPASLSTTMDPLDLFGTDLTEVQWLAGKTVDGVNLGCYANDSDPDTVCPTPSGTMTCSILQGTNLSGTSLKSACLKGANLQGAILNYANLDGADLESAALQATPNGSSAALNGAFMRDVSLRNADLTGVDANYTNFFSSSGGTADASNATMTGTRWANAYLANADFSDAVLQGTVWTGAVLVGAIFNGADLSKNSTVEQVTDFGGAFLHGADFTNAVVTDADFTSSYWDLTGSASLTVLLQSGNKQFAGYWNDRAADECVEASYSSPSTPPLTSTTNICPDGYPGPCDAVWGNPVLPIEEAKPETAVWPALLGSCTTTDIKWIFVTD